MKAPSIGRQTPGRSRRSFRALRRPISMRPETASDSRTAILTGLGGAHHRSPSPRVAASILVGEVAKGCAARLAGPQITHCAPIVRTRRTGALAWVTLSTLPMWHALELHRTSLTWPRARQARAEHG